jgi:hypothetical protein
VPKRIVDGDAIGTSQKLRRVEPVWARAEYALLLTQALANGVFECDPAVIWTRLYSHNRPDMTPKKVAQALDSFADAGMLFRFQDASGRAWGYWIGIEKAGRLPPPSRIERKECFVGPVPPKRELAQYVNASTLNVRRTYVGRTQNVRNTYAGSGSGSGLVQVRKVPARSDSLSLDIGHPVEKEQVKPAQATLSDSKEERKEQIHDVGKAVHNLASKKAIPKSGKEIAQNNGTMQSHLAAGIYRKDVVAAFFDATKEWERAHPEGAGHVPGKGSVGDAVRAAVHAAALSLLSNRAAELRGLELEPVEQKAWLRLKLGQSLAAIESLVNFDRRRDAAVTGAVYAVVSEAVFWLGNKKENTT